MIPYYFIIPKWTIGTDPRTPEQCLVLPPSLTTGPSPQNTASVSYYLSVTAKLRLQGRESVEISTATKPITVIPLTEELPPLETQDFPSEFVESVSRAIRTSILRTAIGTITISACEPPALSYSLSSSCSSTSLSLHIALQAGGNSKIHRRLMATRFFIHGVIRLKTFRSTTPFPKVPSQALLTSRGKIRLADEVKPLAKHNIENCEWQFRPNDEEIPVKRQAESSSGPASAAFIPKQNAKSVSHSWNSRVIGLNGVQTTGHVGYHP